MAADKTKNKGNVSSCECCSNYIYDEDYECYVCDVNLDEDEMCRFMTDTFYDCPYFRMNDEYRIVRKQM
ncbi:MAG: hypothetical protein IJW18_03610 [Lachnospiraceae bacterium]|nr:hypothetical protein [Lachnospiraceae bacterium]